LNNKELIGSKEGLALINKLIAEKSLLDFTKMAWKIIEPGIEFKDNWHLHYLEEELLLLVIDDVGTKIGLSEEYVKHLSDNVFKNRLNINIPPRTMKSLFMNVFFPCWVWIHNPSKKFITVSYSNDLSMDLNQKRREIIQSQWYIENWGNIVKLKDEQNTKTYFENTRQGSMFATSVGGTLTGKGGDIVMLDDIQNPKQAESEADRKRAIAFLTQTLPTRLNDFLKGVIVNIQQRLHYNDVSGYIKDNYDFYKLITLPAETDYDRHYTGPITDKTWTFKTGDVLWPNRMPLSWIIQTKKEQGARTYTSQFLQDPTPPGGNLINPEWFRKWKRLPIYNDEIMKRRKNAYKIVQAWDMNYKEKIGNDNVACSVLLTDGTTTYLIDVFEEQIGFIKTLDAVRDMKEKWKFILDKNNTPLPIEIIIEDKANGPAIMQVLDMTIPGIIPTTPVEDKVTRMTSVTPFMEAGNFLVPDISSTARAQKYAWWPDCETELAKFPYVPHDDFSDSLSTGLRRIYVDVANKRKKMRIF